MSAADAQSPASTLPPCDPRESCTPPRMDKHRRLEMGRSPDRPPNSGGLPPRPPPPVAPRLDLDKVRRMKEEDERHGYREEQDPSILREAFAAEQPEPPSAFRSVPNTPREDLRNLRRSGDEEMDEWDVALTIGKGLLVGMCIGGLVGYGLGTMIWGAKTTAVAGAHTGKAAGGATQAGGAAGGTAAASGGGNTAAATAAAVGPSGTEAVTLAGMVTGGGTGGGMGVVQAHQRLLLAAPPRSSRKYRVSRQSARRSDSLPPRGPRGLRTPRGSAVSRSNSVGVPFSARSAGGGAGSAVGSMMTDRDMTIDTESECPSRVGSRVERDSTTGFFTDVPSSPSLVAVGGARVPVRRVAADPDAPPESHRSRKAQAYERRANGFRSVGPNARRKQVEREQIQLPEHG